MRHTIIIASLALMAPAVAQTALLREADPSPDGTPGQIIDSIGVPGVNQVGGYACSIDTEGVNGDIGQYWGNFTGGPGVLLRQEALIGTLQQTTIEDRIGLTSSMISYGGTANDSASGGMGLEASWIDDTLLAIAGSMAPGTTDFWTITQNTGITVDGVPYFRGGITSVPGGSTQRRGIFFGAPLTPLYLTGDLLPNMPLALSAVAVDADFRFSANGTHNIVPVDLESTSTADDGAMAIDQEGLILGGALVREGENIPLSVGGIGDAWTRFDFCGITEAGDYFFTGDTDGETEFDQFIVRNGTIWAREGDTLGGAVLRGSIEGASINESGNIAFIWAIDSGPGTPDEALFFEDQILLREGDAVDWDGDGVIDPSITIDAFTGTNTVTLGPDGTIYFTADVDVNGTRLEGFFVLEGPGIGTGYCMANANSTGQAGSIIATGSSVIAQNDVTLLAEGLPAASFGFFIVSQTQGFIANPGGSQGNLCVLGSLGRYVGPGQAQSSGPSGTISLAIDLTMIPQPMGTVPVQAGESWNFQLWYRDVVMGLGTSNFTNGHSVLFN